MRRFLECTCVIFQNRTNRVGGVMVRVHGSRAVDRAVRAPFGSNQILKKMVFAVSLLHT